MDWRKWMTPLVLMPTRTHSHPAYFSDTANYCSTHIARHALPLSVLTNFSLSLLLCQFCSSRSPLYSILPPCHFVYPSNPLIHPSTHLSTHPSMHAYVHKHPFPMQEYLLGLTLTGNPNSLVRIHHFIMSLASHLNSWLMTANSIYYSI